MDGGSGARDVERRDGVRGRPEARDGESPREGKSQESQDRRRRGDPQVTDPNRQRPDPEDVERRRRRRPAEPDPQGAERYPQGEGSGIPIRRCRETPDGGDPGSGPQAVERRSKDRDSQGSKPLERGRVRRKPHAPNPWQDTGTDRPNRTERKREGAGKGMSAVVERRLVTGRGSQSQEGKRRREAEATAARSSSEGRTPRTRPVETHRGGRTGSKASKRAGTARTQHDPGNGSPGNGGSDRLGCVDGERTSRERCARLVRARGFAGKTLERGRSLGEWPNR